jgi:hypothetical protein
VARATTNHDGHFSLRRDIRPHGTAGDSDHPVCVQVDETLKHVVTERRRIVE